MLNNSELSLKLENLKKEIIELFGKEIADRLQKELGQTFKLKTQDALEAFGFGLNEEFLNQKKPFSFLINLFLSSGFMVIDNTIVLIINKSNPRPASLYTYFT